MSKYPKFSNIKLIEICFNNQNDCFICKLCQISIKKYQKSNSNLLKHVKISHSDLFIKDNSDEHEVIKNKVIHNNRNFDQKIFNEFVKFIINSSYSISMIENNSFQNFIKNISNSNINIPTRYLVNTRMQEIFNTHVILIKNIINNSMFYSIHLDIWSKKKSKLYIT